MGGGQILEEKTNTGRVIQPITNDEKKTAMRDTEPRRQETKLTPMFLEWFGRQCTKQIQEAHAQGRTRRGVASVQPSRKPLTAAVRPGKVCIAPSNLGRGAAPGETTHQNFDSEL